MIFLIFFTVTLIHQYHKKKYTKKTTNLIYTLLKCIKTQK